MHPTEEKIWQLLPALEKLSGDAQTVAFANAAADSLRQLVATGVFVTLLVDQPLALMQTIENDQNVKNSDRAVAKVLLTAFDSGLGGTKLSNAEISVRSGLSISTVRTSLKHLIAAGYFRSIAPSREEWRDSDHILKYEPQFDCLV
jgi:Winged helix-turn-helix DNA-binding